MKERVSVILGKNPIILVAPHGSDDTNTDIITERVASKTDSCAIINRGFERSDKVDVNKDKADCNRIDHCKEDVVFEEFLKPIIKIKNRLLHNNIKFSNSPSSFVYRKKDHVTILYIHGCGNIVHAEAKEKVALIVGYGLGTKKDSISCELWRKTLFVDLYNKSILDKKLRTSCGYVFEGKGGSRYAGRDSNNMNQYFRKHEPEWTIHSLQLEFPYSTRSSKDELDHTVSFLSNTIKEYIHFDRYDAEPDPKFL